MAPSSIRTTIHYQHLNFERNVVCMYRELLTPILRERKGLEYQHRVVGRYKAILNGIKTIYTTVFNLSWFYTNKQKEEKKSL